MQGDIFAAFKDEVRRRRGSKLEGDDEELFSGRIWTGERALERGLVDGIGDIRSVLRARFGPRVRMAQVNRQRSWLQRRLRFAGTETMAGELLAALEQRLLFNRFGL